MENVIFFITEIQVIIYMIILTRSSERILNPSPILVNKCTMRRFVVQFLYTFLRKSKLWRDALLN